MNNPHPWNPSQPISQVRKLPLSESFYHLLWKKWMALHLVDLVNEILSTTCIRVEQFHVSLIQPANFLRANFQHSAGSAVARASSDRSGAASFRTCNADGRSSKQCWQCVFERKGPAKQNPPSSSSTSWQHLYTYPNIGMRWLKIQKFIVHVCCCIFVINRNRLW